MGCAIFQHEERDERRINSHSDGTGRKGIIVSADKPKASIFTAERMGGFEEGEGCRNVSCFVVCTVGVILIVSAFACSSCVIHSLFPHFPAFCIISPLSESFPFFFFFLNSFCAAVPGLLLGISWARVHPTWACAARCRPRSDVW